MIDLFGTRRRQAKKRLINWEDIRKEKARLDDKKKKIRQDLMDRYEIPEKVHEMFFAYRNEHEIYPYRDEDGDRYDYHMGDILPYLRRGPLVFFYEITDSTRKHGDYGFADSAWFPTLTYNHFEKIPEKKVDPKKSLKIQWEEIEPSSTGRRSERRITGRVQGIRVVNLDITENGCVEATYIEMNFEKPGSWRFPSYYDNYLSITKAKKEAQKLINTLVREDGNNIYQFFIPPKIRRKNR